MKSSQLVVSGTRYSPFPPGLGFGTGTGIGPTVKKTSVKIIKRRKRLNLNRVDYNLKRPGAE